MAAKFKLVPNPTFTIPVMIPRAGEEDGELNITFKHMKLEELKKMQDKFSGTIEKLIKKADAGESPAGLEVLQQPVIVEFLLTIAQGWDLDDDWNKENLTELVSAFPRAFDAITLAFQNELWCLRKKH